MYYKVTSDYYIIRNQRIIKLYFINGVAFTFEEIDNPSQELIEECENKITYRMEDLYHNSQYLIMEQCHPLLFEMEELCVKVKSLINTKVESGINKTVSNSVQS